MNSVAHVKEPKSRVSTTLTHFHKLGQSKSKQLLLEYLSNLDDSNEKSLTRNDSCENTLRTQIPGLGLNKWNNMKKGQISLFNKTEYID